MQQGYTNVFVYNEGYPEWKKAGYPTETMSDIVLNVEIPKISAADLKTALDRGEVTLLDLRDSEDRAGGFIKGALWIPLEDLMAQHAKIPKGKPLVVCCLRGKQGPIAAQYLAKQGYSKVSVLDGGVKDGWQAAGFPLEK